MLNSCAIARELAQPRRGLWARTPGAFVALLLVALATPGPGFAATPPIIDGDLTDMEQYATDLRVTATGVGVVAPDPAQDANVFDPKVIACPPVIDQYFPNGFDQVLYVVAQAANSSDLFLGLRAAGAIGDTDGDGNPDLSGAAGANCTPGDNVVDAPGIGPGDFYEFLFDTQCNSASFSPNGTITITNDQIVGTGTFAGVTGSIAYRGPTGRDLEVVIHNAKLPVAFRVRTSVGSSTDGLSEDAGPQSDIQPNPIVNVLSSAEPAHVCAGKTTRFTLTIENTGTSDLNATNVEDDLPAGLTFAGNVSSTCNVGPPQVNGSSIVWPTFNVPVATLCTISFDAQAAAECIGVVTNQALVATTTIGPCVNAAPLTAQSAFDVTCDAGPCGAVDVCRITGGGCVNADGDRSGHAQNTFGGNASPLHTGGGPTGNEWEHIQRDGKTVLFNWHSHDAHVIACGVAPPGPCSPKAADTRADFIGTGLYSIGAGGRDQEGNMVAYVIDHTEGACNTDVGDYYSIVVRSGLVVGAGDVVFTCAGTLDCGNLQVHDMPAGLPGASTSQPDVQAIGTPMLALLNRAVPNPFTGSTSFAYQVRDGGAAVDIGVYNVAGRLVRALARGAQGAGTYTLTWTGADDSGARMAPGVYFLRSRVGSESTVERLIYLSR